MLLREIMPLRESRKTELEYEEKKVKGQVEKVIVTLTGNTSGKFTKLISKYKKLQKGIEQLQKVQGELNENIKEEVVELFDADDEVLTRIVDTVSATLTLAKKTTVRSEKVDYSAILEKLVEMVPELEEQVKQLVEEHTKISITEKSPALRTTLKEGIKEWAKEIKAIAKHAMKVVKVWARIYDEDLKEVNEMISALK